MKKALLKKYDTLVNKMKIQDENVQSIVLIRKIISTFTSSCENPAIWCYGEHTRMLMVDYIGDMRNVKYIIDEKLCRSKDEGFKIISKKEIVGCHIDGIIISSFRYKEDIKEEIKELGLDVKVLDIYDELEKEGIYMESSYFNATHPCSKYKVINRLQREVINKDLEEAYDEWKEILKLYVQIKDFKTASVVASKLYDFYHHLEDKEIAEIILEIYELQLEMISKVSSTTTIMLCIDGLRSKDVENGKMPCLKEWVNNNTYYYTNAYSSSTSTFESLVPVYGLNNDLQTEYYKKQTVKLDESPMFKKAISENREVYFYTETDIFVESDKIKRSNITQTATQKLWKFTLDSYEKENALFLIHILYESHFSYSNPYTQELLIADGTSIMFDFLDSKGGRLRTDYEKQQEDALRYLDDVVMPFVKRLNCGMVLYADHGNILMNQEEKLEDLEESKYTFHDDLIKIPLAIYIPGGVAKKDNALISLMELNNIVSALLDGQEFIYKQKDFIKVQRSEIYNPDFKYLYKKTGNEKGLHAFELFHFVNGINLVVYDDGTMEMYKNGEHMNDDVLLESQKCVVKKYITVI